MNDKIPLAGVIGHPVAHSMSPRLHGYWLKQHGIVGHYVPMDVHPADLGAVLNALPRAGFKGVNITLPHKEAALSLAASASDRAVRIGSANTLTFLPGGGFQADCTDGLGFLENLRQSVPDWSPSSGPVAVYGAGGAARAVLDALVSGGATDIRLTNRTRERAIRLAEAFDAPIKVLNWSDASHAADGATTLVNTTSLGMAGQPAFDIPLEGMAQGAVATDIVYTPLDTPFLQAARACGAMTVDGLGMLLHQAVPGFAQWFGVTPDVTVATRDMVLRG